MAGTVGNGEAMTAWQYGKGRVACNKEDLSWGDSIVWEQIYSAGSSKFSLDGG